MKSNRNCPIDNNSLYEITLKNEKIEICPICQGMFFDGGELEHISHLVELFRSIRLNESDIEASESLGDDSVLACPVDGEKMTKREIGGQIVDICPKCNGIWLDNGEIIALRMAERHIIDNLNLYIRLGQ